MKRIGIISDTHGFWDERYKKYFEECNEIWHAGDIGSYSIVQQLGEIAMLRAVYGNCDGYEIRSTFSEINRFKVEDIEIVMKHIGGSPGHYDNSIRSQLYNNKQNLFVCGHSHILKVQFDKDLNMLFINPGAAGVQGWQKVRTLIRLTIDGDKFKDLEVIEIERGNEKLNTTYY